MAWVKRNLGLVVGGLVALALLGVAGFYLWSKVQEDAQVTTELQEATAKYTELINKPPHPGNEISKVNNIELAKEENKRLEAFVSEVRAKFGKREVPTNLSDRDFRLMLDNTVAELIRGAASSGVKLPETNYWFTFGGQKTATSFKSIPTLTHRLMEVKDLCEILYAAKIPDLKGLKRVPASSDENSGMDFLTDKKATTNEYAIVTPYEITFQGFSSEIGRVMDRLISANQCYVVKSVAVDQAGSDDGQPQGGGASQEAMMQQMQMMMRYGGMARGGRGFPGMPPPQAAAPAATGPKRPPGVVLDENKLKVVMLVDVVRLKDAPDKPGRGSAPPAAEPAASEAPAASTESTTESPQVAQQ